ncbi:hypothetical protein GPJ56_003347 [Histomonas meleagridis]|uniref:uncharacterized protein n=1 Tax=Histomonas meleagridis TaxID=135588 RepID=UPI00355AA965|nr:hypothetical protein GPJ56_003347 [Histomonas meleagridis]KAH0804966.1 hypothetical protein GO595_001911 [Histomonas meleagridis]
MSKKKDLAKWPPKLESRLTDFEMDYLVLECYAVRRPLFVPSTIDVIGQVLSHSALIAVTAQGSFIIEYMFDSMVHVRRCDTYEKSKDFEFEGIAYVHDDPNPQYPSRPVTIKRLAASMANFMAGKKFDTFSHNCHMARYLTMKKYGMESINPWKNDRNIFFQGVVDFFKPHRPPKIEHNNETAK